MRRLGDGRLSDGGWRSLALYFTAQRSVSEECSTKGKHECGSRPGRRANEPRISCGRRLRWTEETLGRGATPSRGTEDVELVNRGSPHGQVLHEGQVHIFSMRHL